MTIEIMTAQEAKEQALNGYDIECRKDVANAIVTAVNKKEMKTTVRVLTPTVEVELVEKGYYVVKKGNGWVLTWNGIEKAEAPVEPTEDENPEDENPDDNTQEGEGQ